MNIHLCRSSCLLALPTALAGSFVFAGEEYDLTTLKGVGVGYSVVGTDLNNAGQAVGVATTIEIDPLAFQPWIWLGNNQLLDLIPGESSNQFFRADAINDHGMVVGTIFNPPPSGSVAGNPNGVITQGLPIFINSDAHAVIWSTDGSGNYTVIEGLGPQLGLPHYGNTAVDVNNTGRIVGSSGDGGTPQFPQWRAYMRDELGVVHDLSAIAGPNTLATSATAINEQNQICGTVQVGEYARVFFHDSHAGTVVLPTLLNAQPNVSEYHSPMDMNDHGHIVGIAEILTVVGEEFGFPLVVSETRGFLWEGVGSSMVDLGGFTPMDINNASQIVGWSAGTSAFGAAPHAYLLDRGKYINLQEQLEAHNCSHGSSARSINDDGQILVVEHYCPETIWIQNLTHLLTPVITAPSSDLNADGQVNVDDLLLLLNAWGACASCNADLNADGQVSVDDLLLLIADWS